MAMKKIWDNCQSIGEVLKSPSTKIRVELVARDGVKYINIREWYLKKSEGVWKPGLAGFAMPVVLPVNGAPDTPAMNLMDTIQEALELAPAFKLEDEANAVWVESKK